MYCNKCGMKLEKNKKKCTNCGEKNSLAKNKKKQKKTNTEDKQKYNEGVIFAVIALLLIIPMNYPTDIYPSLLCARYIFSITLIAIARIYYPKNPIVKIITRIIIGLIIFYIIAFVLLWYMCSNVIEGCN
jgi:hypothetical protein